MYKIGVIGDKESIQGFSALGFDIFPCDNAMDVEESINKLARQDYAVIYITENAAKDSFAVIDQYKEQMSPAIILIPGKEGSLGLGMKNVRKSVEQAVGADILFKDQ